MKKIWIKRSRSFKESEEIDKSYYLSMSGTERLELMQFLRDIYLKIKSGRGNEDRKGLWKIIKVIQ